MVKKYIKKKGKSVKEIDLETAPETEVAIFFLDFKQKYRNVILYCFLSLIFLAIFGIYVTQLENNGLYLLILLALLASVFIFENKKAINFKDYDDETKNGFIRYMEENFTSSKVLSSKEESKGISKDINHNKEDKEIKDKEKKYNEILTKIQKIQQDSFIKVISSPKSVLRKIVDYVFISPILFGCVILILYFMIPTQISVWNIIIYNIFPITTLVFYTISFIYLYGKIVDYRNVKACSALFGLDVKYKLGKIVNELKRLIQTKIQDIIQEEEKLITDFDEWYILYCSRFSSNDDWNDIISQYHKFIFTTKEEIFYLKLFSNIKGKINNYYVKQNLEASDTKLVKSVQNLIDILEKNVHFETLKKNQRREPWNTAKNIIYLLIAPVSLIFSIIALFTH